MSAKKLTLFIFLSLVAIASGTTFGLLDLFGFIDGRHTLSLTLLLLGGLLTYINLVIVFLLNLANQKRVHTFLLIASILFGIPFYMMTLQPLFTVLATILYLFFLSYTYSASVKRSEMFVSFTPKEIFFPILRTSFTFFLVLLALIAFMQSQRLIQKNNLISPALIKTISRPTVFFVNRQINAQLKPALETPVFDELTESQRRQVVYTALEKTVQSMAGQSDNLYGIPVDDIPVERARVDRDGTIDVSPVIDAIFPQIADMLNERIESFAPFAPIVVALIAFLILQPIIIPIQLIESLITIALFKILVSTGFIKIKTEERVVEKPTL